MSNANRYNAGRYDDIGNEYYTDYVFVEDNDNVKEDVLGKFVTHEDYESVVRLAQRLVNALEYVASYDNGCPLPTWEKGYNEAWGYANAVRKDADELGFKVEDL